jgi:hypothetical protein
MESPMSNTTMIPVERIASGTLIYVRDHFNAAAEVLEIEWDGGDRYVVTYGTDDWQDVTGFDVGSEVECFNHQTFLRADGDVSEDELEAKLHAVIANDRAARDVLGRHLVEQCAKAFAPLAVAAE